MRPQASFDNTAKASRSQSIALETFTNSNPLTVAYAYFITLQLPLYGPSEST